MRVGLVGDVHGAGFALARGLRAAADAGCDVVVQLGDFGIWPGASGQKWRKNVASWLRQRDQRLYVVPGNHEDYSQIDALVPDETGWLPWIPGRCWLAPRGHTWTWDGLRFGAMGGAVSIDKQHRTPGKSWWPQESITAEEADRMASEAGPLDVLLVHDTPQGAHAAETDNKRWGDTFGVPEALLAAARTNRERLRQVVEATQPWLVVGGHWHKLLLDQITLASGKETAVVNLSSDGTVGSVAVLDTETKTLQIEGIAE